MIQTISLNSKFLRRQESNRKRL